MSFNFPFRFLSCSFQCAFSSFHLPFICMHFPFIVHSFPFKGYGTGFNGVIAKSSLRLSLNKPFKWLVGGAITILKNMSSSMGRIIPDILENKQCLKPPTRWHCSKDIFHQTTEREREKESERVGCQMIWYSICRKQGTKGGISLIGFASWVNVHNSICLVYAKFNGLSCTFPGYRFWGSPIALQCLVRISDKKLLQY